MVKIIRELTRRSIGYDQVAVELIKNIAENISLILAHTINKSFSIGVLPDVLKKYCYSNF